jgi:hypothetical protein
VRVQGEVPDEDTIRKLIRKGTITGKFVPMLCGSAFKNKGVQPLLDAVVDYLPSPLDLPAVKGSAANDPEQVRPGCGGYGRRLGWGGEGRCCWECWLVPLCVGAWWARVRLLAAVKPGLCICLVFRCMLKTRHMVH